MAITALASSFAPPIKPQSLPSGQLKRKNRESLHPDDDRENDSDESVHSSTTTTALDPQETTQYQTAGHGVGKPVPEKPFPHAAEERRKSRWIRTKTIQKRLSEQNPPLHVHRSLLRLTDETSSRARLKHINHLTTLFHRCLLQGLIPQAYRAFLLILGAIPDSNANPKSHRPQEKLRVYGHWALATELIMKGVMTSPDIKNAPSPSSDENVNKPYSPRNLHLARSFLEMLIIQYPTPRSNLLTDSARYTAATAPHFYNAFFSVWLYEITQGQSGISFEHSDSVSLRGHVAALKEHASQLASRLDLILASIEYSLVPQLLVLRGHVELWLGTLTCDLLRAQTSGSASDTLPEETVSSSLLSYEMEVDSETGPEADEGGEVELQAGAGIDADGDVDMAPDDALGPIPPQDVDNSVLVSTEALHRTRAEKFFSQAEKYTKNAS